jgi:prevent-host-death family protein
MIPSDGRPHLGVRELRADLATHVRRAGGGERVVITVDGKPVAQLGPLTPTTEPTLDDLAASGLIRLPAREDKPEASGSTPILPIDLSPDRVLAELRGDPPRRR